MKEFIGFFILLIIIQTNIPIFGKTVRVACVGNSITYGMTLPLRDEQAYPACLQRMLGDAYEVRNFGRSGTTLLSKGHNPYIRTPEYKDALDFAADIVLIHLGINDTDPRNWPNYKDDFVNDYVDLIHSFRRVNPNCRVIVARLTPITVYHPRFVSGTRDWRESIQNLIETVVRATGVEHVDFEKSLYVYPHLLPDAIHPNPEGAEKLAYAAYSAITGNFGGLRMLDIYTDNMVLQREVGLKIAGKANAGDEITVTIGKQSHTAITGSDGYWEVQLSPLKAGGPYTLVITDGKKCLRYENVLVGEVWLCSGQSNMEFMMQSATTASRDIPDSYCNEIRLFNQTARWKTNAVKWSEYALDSVNELQYYKDACWEIAAPETIEKFSAVAYYFGKMLQDSLKVPIGLICNAVGGSPTESWIDRRTLEKHFPDIVRNWRTNDFIQPWVRERASLNVSLSTNKLQRHPYEPCYLYEAGIQPLEQFPLRGVIWYQGESNAHNVEAHERLFTLLVDSWRRNWNNRNLPFYYVQLSSLSRPSWPSFRDSQRRLMDKIPNVAMVVSSDEGDSLDVHPRDKKPVGERLARWALYQTYHWKHIVPSGPLFRSVRFNGQTVEVLFDHGRGMHGVGNAPITSFELAEFEGLYKPAVVKVAGDTLKIFSNEIKHPRHIRYAWQPFTRANLVNGEELPASTFCAHAPALSEIFNLKQTSTLLVKNKAFVKGVSAPFAGCIGEDLVIAGGCNFPDVPAEKGGTKVYYKDVYAARIEKDTLLSWRKVGELPQPMAYGFSVSTSDGIVCVGGMNEDGAMEKAFRLSMVNGRLKMEDLPSLPFTMDNMSGCLADNSLFVMGGNRDGKASNAFLRLDLDNLSEGWIELPSFPGKPRIQPVCAAQKDETGEMAIYMWGGFSVPAFGVEASLSTDGYKYQLEKKSWISLPSPADSHNETVSLGGGAAVSIGDSLILCMGGVNKDVFLQALRQPEPDYLSHPAEWYKFNRELLAYHVFNHEWQTICVTSMLARAGAVAVPYKNAIIYVNGEVKPGVRTPTIVRISLSKP